MKQHSSQQYYPNKDRQPFLFSADFYFNVLNVHAKNALVYFENSQTLLWQMTMDWERFWVKFIISKTYQKDKNWDIAVFEQRWLEWVCQLFFSQPCWIFDLTLLNIIVQLRCLDPTYNPKKILWNGSSCVCILANRTNRQEKLNRRDEIFASQFLNPSLSL